METHLKILAALHIFLGSMEVIGALALLFIFGGIAGVVGVANESPETAIAVPIIGGIGGLLFLFVLLLALPGIIGGIGLLRRAPWSRIFMIVVSALYLVHIPFGTALGIYGIWALTKPETQALLARHYQPSHC